jgi:methylated-DNA-[protein]-cysteine S-methyltransferase
LIDYHARVVAPFAVLGVRSSGEALRGIDFLPPGTPALSPADPIAERTAIQLQRYLNDPEFSFDLPIVPVGTPYRQKVWRALREIPCGRVLSYGELARQLGSGPRAVGQACGANPIPIVIPCHRVVSAAGVGGFMHHADGAPIDYKQWLLRHEGWLR